MYPQRHRSWLDRVTDKFTVEELVWIGAGVVLVEWFAFGIVSLLGRG